MDLVQFKWVRDGFDQIPKSLADDLGPRGKVQLHSKVDTIVRYQDENGKDKVSHFLPLNFLEQCM